MRRNCILLCGLILTAAPDGRASAPDPDCLTGMATVKQGMAQLSKQNLNNPKLEQQINQLNEQLRQYEAYAPQVRDALDQSQQILNSVPGRVCSEFACIDLTGVKNQTQSAINNARSEWSRIGSLMKQQARQQQTSLQNDAFARARDAADRAAEQMQMRVMQQMEKRCKQNGGKPNVPQAANNFYVQPKLQPVQGNYGRLDFSTAKRELHLPHWYKPKPWPPEKVHLPGYPRPAIAEEYKPCTNGGSVLNGCAAPTLSDKELVHSWLDEPPAQFARRAGGLPQVLPNPVAPPLAPSVGGGQRPNRVQPQGRNQTDPARKRIDDLLGGLGGAVDPGGAGTVFDGRGKR